MKVARPEMSPKSTVNSIIDRCHMATDEEFYTMDNEGTNDESMFDMSQQLAEAFNPLFKSLDQRKRHTKSCVRPGTMATKKKVTFQLTGGEGEGETANEINSESMSESLSSDGSPPIITSRFPSKSQEQKDHLKNVKNYKRISNFYKPALMTKNFTREMPMFLSEKNMASLNHMFKSMKFKNKYEENAKQSKRFKFLKNINQQKTKTQDRLGELTEAEDIKGFLEKEPKEIFANALRNFWFKDADTFIRKKKLVSLQKDSLWDRNEPDVYARMEVDRVKRSQRVKKKTPNSKTKFEIYLK